MSKPNERQRHAHVLYAMTEKQAIRLASGRKESHPTDYAQPTQEQKRRAAARAALEDRALMKELGL